jgi:hypothetical protein
VVLVRGLHMWLGNEGACSFFGVDVVRLWLVLIVTPYCG